MILWIDEFGEAYVANALDDSLIQGVIDGGISVYTFDTGTNTYRQYDGEKWVAIK